jgi:hypothetical protein
MEDQKDELKESLSELLPSDHDDEEGDLIFKKVQNQVKN